MSFSVCMHMLSQFFEWALRASWQGAILVVAVLFAQLVLRRQLNARWRFNLWLLVVLRLLMPFSPESAVSVFNFVKPHSEIFLVPVAQRQADSIPVTPSRDNSPVLQKPIIQEPSAGVAKAESIQKQAVETITPDGGSIRSHSPSFFPKWLDWLGVAAVIWFLGAAGLSSYVILLMLRTRREVRRATPIIDPVVLDVFEECRRQMGVRRSLPLLVTNIVKSPALCGVLKPALLLPPGLTANFSLRELRYVFLHELGHVKRHDVSLNWLLAILQIFHWFNPVVWFGFARMRADRELACDELAISFAREEDSKDYGRTIIKLLETLSRSSAMPGLVGILEDRSQMKRRIQMIAAFKKSRRWSIPALLVMGALALTGLTDAVTPKQADSPLKTAEPADVLAITVLDAATGKPVKGAHIINGYSAFMNFQTKPPMLETDENGVVLAPRKSVLSSAKGFAVLHPEYEPKAVTWVWGYPSTQTPPKFPEIPNEYTIKLDRGVEIGGIVLDEAGKPISNVRVEIKGMTMPQEENPSDPAALEYPFYNTFFDECPITDAEGRWHCSHFSKQIERVELSLVRPDNSCVRFHTEKAAAFASSGGDLIKMDDLLSNQLELMMKNGVDVLGTVVDSAGKPLAGITLTEIDGRKHSRPLSVLTTGSDGRFELPNRDPHQIMIKASGPGFALNPAVVDVRAGMPEARIQMSPAKPLLIRVVDEAERPIANAGMGWLAGTEMGWTARSGDDGRIAWNEAPAEPLDYFIAAEHYGQTVKKITPDGTEQVIVLRKGGSPGFPVTVKAETVEKKPVDSFSVSFVCKEKAPELIGEGKAGVFDGSIPYGKVRSPDFRLKIEAPGCEPVLTTPYQSMPGGPSVTVTLRKAEPLEGVVLQPDGTVAKNARLIMGTEDDNDYIGLKFTPGVSGPEGVGNHVQTVRADETGRFSFPSPGDDKAIVITHENGFLETSFKRLRRSPELHLEPWGRLEGTLVVNSKPKTVQLLELLPKRRPTYWLSVNYDVTTNSKGDFVFEQVPPGDYTLVCTKPSSGTWPRSYPLPVKIVARETTKVAYEATVRNVIGKIQALPAGTEVDWRTAMTTKLLSRKQAKRNDEPPALSDFVRMEDYQEANKDWARSLGSQPIVDSAELEFESDGSFHAEGIPLGEYELHVEITDPTQKRGGQWKNLGSIRKTVVVPPAPSGDPESPVDLGTFHLSVDAISTP